MIARPRRTTAEQEVLALIAPLEKQGRFEAAADFFLTLCITIRNWLTECDKSQYLLVRYSSPWPDYKFESIPKLSNGLQSYLFFFQNHAFDEGAISSSHH